MNMKKTFLLLTLCCALIACRKTQVDFTFSPTAPRAGETVRFTNLSSSGEEWEWSFGDGAISTLKSPGHTYKRPGSYLVVLKVDKKNSLRETKEITVYDTIPTFVCEDSVFYIYEDYTFTANVYNPYNYEVEYEWTLPANTLYAVITDTVPGDGSLHLYFIKPMDEAPIWLNVIMNGDTMHIEKTFPVRDTTLNSMLIRTTDGDYRQRIFGDRAEQPQLDAAATPILDAEQDTVQTYNGFEFKLSELKTVFPELEGFHIANRKIYYRESGGGLWVANIDGTNAVQIDEAECLAMTLDTHDSRIYWANAQGVWYMPFIGSDNNKFVTTPLQLNNLSDVTKLAANPIPNE